LARNPKNLIDNFMSRVKVALQEYGIDNERLIVKNLNQILDQFRNELNAQLQTIGNAHQGGVVPAEHVENGQEYTVHMHSGRFSQIPKDWHFPLCSVFDLWRQWWVGDQV